MSPETLDPPTKLIAGIGDWTRPGPHTGPTLEGFRTVYGVQISGIGDECELIALGHVGRLRAYAAFNRYAHHELGEPLGELMAGDPVDRIEHQHATVVEHCDDYPECSTLDPADEPADDPDPCWTCVTIADSSWYLSWGDKPTPGSFPVTLWRY